MTEKLLVENKKLRYHIQQLQNMIKKYERTITNDSRKIKKLEQELHKLKN
jgi:type VII secretion effector (TIGR04197 family)